MPQPQPGAPTTPPADERSQAVAASSRALAVIEQLGAAPNPENFALFYHYALGVNLELAREVDSSIASRLPFSTHMLKNMYNKYVVANNNRQLLNEVTQGTNKMLGEVLRIVGDFSSQTNTYAQDIDGYMHKINTEIDDPNLAGIVRGLISATAGIKARGESLSNKLQESRVEIESLRKNLDQLTQESQRDFLTGAYNRKALDTILAEYFVPGPDTPHDISVLMLDVDHFKLFNDKFGHLLGDEVLKIVVRAITHCVRGGDIVARYGGEEFCVILPGTPLSGAGRVAENIRATIASRDLKRKDTGESFGSLTVSVGAAQLRQGDIPEALLKRADEALYKSKRTGRNKVTLDGVS